MKPQMLVTTTSGRTLLELKAPGIHYVFEDNEDGRKALNKITKKFK